jgi:hypothetical protein
VYCAGSLSDMITRDLGTRDVCVRVRGGNEPLISMCQYRRSKRLVGLG